ncbi:phosphoethanolamine--lipid A transferase [Acinetobacter sp. B5B]|uniref:phosphoethanolamine transferase n=1 Tax=Acinetobacter baretiae TaxID=2605383 RepID=UPI0018C20615|nr:phosphoethanolamine--lipid A transferase [Acinetobacter baretiae]MBF7682576.1 phosphoethanolamine--lipid A transferase [Acinetobacter baretiae]
MRLPFKFKQLNMSLFVFNLLLAIWMAGFANFRFYQKVAEYSAFHGFYQFLFLCVTFLILTGLYLFILQIISWRRTAKIVAVFLIILTASSSYFVNQLGIDITKEQIQNVMQTDIHEVQDLISVPLFIHFVEFLFIPLILLMCIQIQPKHVLKTIYQKIMVCFITLFITGLGLFSFYGQYAPIFREHREMKGQISPLNIIANGSSYFKKQFKQGNPPLVAYGTDAKFVGQGQPPKIVVLVVGETGRAQSFSLNGYQRPTNPQLSQIDLVNFTAASSCGTQTAVSLPCMFSGMSRKEYDEGLASHREGLLDIAKRAGYEVTWIDNNSGCKGACDRIQHVIIPKDQPQYKQWCDGDGECYDEVLLQSLQNYLKGLDIKSLKANQLIVLHQVGSHGPAYYKRYPKAFETFTPTCATNSIQKCTREQLINTYDNTIVYTDYIVSSVVKQLQALPVASSMMYLSDHGESTGENGMYLHGAPYIIAPKEQTHIPMMLWFSEQWPNKKQYSACLKAKAHDAVSQDYLFPTVLNLLDVKTQVADPNLDLLHRCEGS